MSNTIEKLREIGQDIDTAQRFVELFAEMLAANYDIVPGDDAIDFVESLATVCETPEGDNFISILLGTASIDDLVQEYVDMESDDEDE